MTALFYDTETTGMPLWDQPSEDPQQPHIVQLCAWLVDPDTRKTVAGIDLIVKPDGWEVPPAATSMAANTPNSHSRRRRGNERAPSHPR